MIVRKCSRSSWRSLAGGTTALPGLPGAAGILAGLSRPAEPRRRGSPLWFIALVVVVGVLSTVASRAMTKKKGAMWIWDHSNVIGWLLIGAGLALVASGFLIDQSGTAMSAKLGLGSLLLIAGLWMIW